MPSGATHDRITLWSLPWLVGCSYALTGDGELTLIIAAGYLFSGLMFGPDLDIYSRQFKRWGKLRWLWLPYQKMLTHRSLLSHGVIIGTTLRLLYLGTFCGFIAIIGIAIIQLIGGFDWNWQEFAKKVSKCLAIDYRQQAIALFVGLELGAISHSVSDWTKSIYQRGQKKGWKIFQPQPKPKKRPKSSVKSQK
jgi:uncharacterized metal-binding protein